MRRLALPLAVLSTSILATPSVRAQVPVTQTRFELPSSNGHGAIVVSLAEGARRVLQFREHLFSAEEFVLDAAGDEVWNGSGFAAVHTRDLLFDAYFGLRGPAGSTWLPTTPIDLEASGYVGPDDDTLMGTGIVAIAQQWGELSATTYAFAPFDFPHAGFVMLLRVRNDGATTADGVQAFSLHNLHLGEGRPASPFDVGGDISAANETLEHFGGGASAYFHERGFAGVTVTRALAPVTHFGAAPGQNPYAQVLAGDNLGDNPTGGTIDAVGAWQFNLGSLSPGEEGWAGVIVDHWGDPFAAELAQGWIDDWVLGRTAEQIFDDERAAWSQFHAGLTVPPELDAYESQALRQSAAMLRMGQVRETTTYLREWFDQDGVPRRTRLPSLDAPATLPDAVEHRGHGAVLASLPPGNWTYAWIRDGAYAVSAMASLGMTTEAKDGLDFYLQAESGRFADWTELADYDLPPYLISLVRYLGFGVEETDFNDFGPNLEFDGFGLFLWAMGNYVDATGDVAFAEDHWDDIATRVADPIIALVEPDTGLLRPDSSIWETHWNGRQRHWAYTNITAARGLCDAAELAEQLGDDARAQGYRDAGLALRAAIATQLVDDQLAIASNAEELAVGEGYADAAVVDAIAMGLFDPQGAIATATLSRLDADLLTPASEVGWSRNDDQTDHAGQDDLSPWGSVYDGVEWVVTDLRGAIAFRDGGDVDRSDALLLWVTAQTLANWGMTAETYDRDTGTYAFNTPMLGFGAGAYALALAHRGGALVAPACGAYYEDDGGGDTTGGADTTGSGEGTGGSGGSSGSASGDTGGVPTTSASEASAGSLDGSSSGAPGESGGSDGCGCASDRPIGAVGALPLVMLIGRRRRRTG